MRTEAHREVERKYDVGESASLPELHELPGVDRVAQPVEHHLEATYYDTGTLALARAGVTLRRRTGGEDAGWHLKLPVGKDEKREVRHPLDDTAADDPAATTNGAAPPPPLLDLVGAYVRDGGVVPVARLRTRRVVHDLLDGDAQVLAQVCDDHVAAEPGEGLGARQEWREWEVELVGGGVELLDEAEQVLAEAGAHRAPGRSKLSRALADGLGRPDGAKAAVDEETAGGFVLGYLRRTVARMEGEDARVRLDEEDSLHQMRVAIRRLRAALATYRPLLDRDAANALRVELKWLGLALGRARDAEVLRARLLPLVAAEPPELVLGRVAERIDDEQRAAYADGRAQAMEALHSARYFRLLDGLDALVAEVPHRGAASEPVEDVLPDLLRRDWKRLRRAAGAFDRAEGPGPRDAALHEVRKAAKRLRYGAEAAEPALGEPAAELAKAAEGVQDLLGEHQDSVVAREVIRQIAVRAYLDGENAFTFGRLHALEQERAQDIDKPYARALRELSRSRLPGWPKLAKAPKAPRSPTA